MAKWKGGAHSTAVVKSCSALACAQEIPVCHSTSMMLLYTAACGRHPDLSMASKVSNAAHLLTHTQQAVNSCLQPLRSHLSEARRFLCISCT